MGVQLSTASFYDSNARRLSSMSARAQTLQTEIATGKRITTPSQDPAVAQQLAELTRKDSDAAAYGANMTLAGSLLTQADGVLGQIATQLQRARELTTQAATGTQNSETRKIIGTELESIVGAIAGLANTRNVRGQPLFGTPDGTPAVVQNTGGGFTYAPINVSEVPIADGQSVQATESAARIFTQADGTDTLKMLSDLAAALKDNATDGSAANAALDKISAATDQVSLVQASIGARSARVELQQSLATTANTDRGDLRSKLEDTDVTSAVIELQQLMTALSATQASFTKLSGLSLFDYLR
ncbi:flagellar hook-associated protein 3 FlgL [Sphingomonas sp. SORGH_AS802]|uniref:flagellin N-terminal helical domain-containing protein n=1 Tax=unclassified Sphingomonas TaxID=196159 RepID=UPI002861E8F4|nr:MULTISPECIES: flagellar hook-associated protein 3 [unclassified Sphingomonas]MDR6128296.1 flagellar hook-associated protein 3 FlgL [Sphingomonas sp. SORGH_AS_0438]MDR6135500.1 flagellar hook-associated protein 3 FlgL [Sphingomonas sp. SORGH_AS_0802]